MASRLDLILKHLCLAKSRSSARKLCDGGFVLLNGVKVRASSSVRVGDRITIHLPNTTTTVELLDVPQKQVAKAAVVDYCCRITTPSSEQRSQDIDPLEGW